MSNEIAVDSHAPVGHRLFVRWLNRPVVWYTGKVGELRTVLPRFQRRPGRYGQHEIISDKTGETVVSHVSSNYDLVQHHALLDALPEVVGERGYELDELQAELFLTLRGERMQLIIHLPAQAATPPDGFSLACRLRCLNSVDRTTALEAELAWYRQICSNGMFGWASDTRLKRVHRFGDTLDWVKDRLSQRFEQLPQDRIFFNELSRVLVRSTQLQEWGDQLVAAKWGKEEAARVLHICRTGLDAQLTKPFGTRLAHELEVSPAEAVPGACAPVSNVYHVGQALSWVASRASALHTQFGMMAILPSLLRPLMN